MGFEMHYSSCRTHEVEVLLEALKAFGIGLGLEHPYIRRHY